MKVLDYATFLDVKTQGGADSGFDPVWMPSFLFDFQASLLEWAVRKGRAAIFADCGLGKTPMGLVWASNVARKTGKPVLFLTPLAVTAQTVREAEKFGVDAIVNREGSSAGHIVVTNYERLHYFNPEEFSGVVCDESSILKSFAGVRRADITTFMRKVQYRLLQTATAAPNDYLELGTSSEALGYLGHMDMLNRFFKNDLNNSAQGRMRGEVIKWRLKGHAELPFWRWVCSWARAIRRPSDLGFNDARFILPPLYEKEHLVQVGSMGEGMLFDLPAVGLQEQREERRRSIGERCEKVAELVNTTGQPALVWCHLNEEGDLLRKLIPDSVQVAGSDKDDVKEARLTDFAEGRSRVLVTKPKLGAWGLNFQHCNHVTFFPSHCYDETTEVLTKRGWLTFGVVSLDDELATVNPESLAFEWQSPTDVIWSPYSGPMISFNSGDGDAAPRSFDLLVTPNHRMFVKRCEVRYKANAGEWGFLHADELQADFKRQEYRMLSSPKSFTGTTIESVHIPWPQQMNEGHGRLKRVDTLPADKFMALAGWYLSEGYCGCRQGYYDGQITITQTDKNPEHRVEIIALLNSIPGMTVHSETKDIRCCSRQLALYLVEQFGAGSRQKRIPRWVKELDVSLLAILRDTMLKGDGCAHERGGQKWFYRTTSKQLADDFSEICLKTGIRASVRLRGELGEYGDCYDVSLARENVEPSVHVKPGTTEYNGMIGCASVPNRTLIVRRNGIPVVSGNSFEQYYQAVRRCWRFGQQRPVQVDVVTSPGESGVMKNLQRKADQADAMFSRLVDEMNQAIGIARGEAATKKMELPSWLATT